jgi:N-acetylglucosaminyl-diphospho-decaprenol L-rhamnosyltransferase
MDPHLSIIIVNWNTGSLLTDCVKSVKASILENGSPQTEILVVDNDSSDESLFQARTTYPDIRVIESSSNLGFGPANNLAARHAKGEFLLFLNPDTVLKPTAIRLLSDHLTSSPQVAAVGPKLLNQDGSVQLSIFRTPTLSREAWRLFHLDRFFPYNAYPAWLLSSTEPQDVDVLQGTCLLMRRDVFFSIGQFDERFFMYSEEVDLCVRMLAAGWHIHWHPQALVIHIGGQSTKLVADQMFLMLYRNKVEFFRKHYGQPDTTIYKLLLYLVSLSRYLPGTLVKTLSPANSHSLRDSSRQYGLMLKEISSF